MSFLNTFFIVCSAFGFIHSSPKCQSLFGYGVCIAMDRCEFATHITKTKGTLSQEYLEFVTNNFCGFYHSSYIVCCPTTDVQKTNPWLHNDPMEYMWKKLQQTSEKSSYTPDVMVVQNITPELIFTTESTMMNLELEKSTISSVATISIKEVTRKSKINKSSKALKPSLLPEKCSSKYNKRMVGGQIARLSEFPWMALLEYEKSRMTLSGCSGSLISERYVLTAGHCVRSIPDDWQLKRVRLGEYNIQTEVDCEPEGDDGIKCAADQVVLVSIEETIVHEDFGKPHNYANDIALLRLSQNAPNTNNVHPICMARSLDLGNLYWAAGWGRTEFKSQSSVMLKVSLPRFDFDKCSKLYASKNVTLGEGQICVGGVSGKDTCTGDSGGPLMRLDRDSWVLDGIVSIGHSSCGNPRWPAVYTRVFHYIPWILSNLRP